jgi:hypothetical protein
MEVKAEGVCKAHLKRTKGDTTAPAIIINNISELKPIKLKESPYVCATRLQLEPAYIIYAVPKASCVKTTVTSAQNFPRGPRSSSASRPNDKSSASCALFDRFKSFSKLFLHSTIMSMQLTETNESAAKVTAPVANPACSTLVHVSQEKPSMRGACMKSGVTCFMPNGMVNIPAPRNTFKVFIPNL